MGYKPLLLVFLLMLPSTLWAEELIINTPITIDSTDFSYENKSIVVDGAAVVINGAHKFTNLKLINGGSLTHDEENYLKLDVEQRIEILSGEINVSGKGLLADEFASALSGGSHIGYGGVATGSVAGIAYGDFKTPATSGRGGRSASIFVDASNSSRGGGTVILKADELILNGSILSQGQSTYSFSFSVGGAAGGSVAIDVRKISESSGYIVTNGSEGYNGAGNGSGGVISIKYEEASEATTYSDYGHFLQGINMLAWGGTSSDYRGATGTIYLENKTSGKGKLYVQGFPYYQGPYYDEKNYFKARTYVTGIAANTDFIIDRASIYVANSDPQDINIADGCKSGKAIVEFSQTLNINSINANCEKGIYVGFQQDLNLTSSIITTSNGKMDLDVSGQLTTQDSTLTLVNTALGLHQPHNFTTLELNNNSTITSGFPDAFFKSTIEPAVLDVSAQNISIDSTSAIDVSGKGIIKRLATCTSYGHGGKGKDITSEIYGNHNAPTHFGTGCISNDEQNTVYGGGALKLTVNNLLLNGAIRANANGTNGGSGGSIWVDAESIQRNSAVTDPQIITANGNTDGGGGRVFIHSRNVEGLDLTVNAVAQGYSAGTVYIKDKDDPSTARLLVKNPVLNPNALTSANLLAGDELTVNNANLEIESSIALEDIPRSLLENAVLVFSNPVTVDEDFIWPSNARLVFRNGLHLNGSIQDPASPPLNNLSIYVSGTLSSSDDNLIVNGYKLEISNNLDFEKIELLNGGSITTPRVSSATQPVIELNATEILIDATSKIDVSGKGLSFDPANEEYEGASHGGKGGRTLWFADNKPSITHGSFAYPVSYGYGAQISAYGGPTYGGGAIKISADIFTLEGKLIADGDMPYATNRGGSAAGGSLLLDVGILQSQTGNFLISASGGNGVDITGGGGGGRIAIYYNNLENIDKSRIKAFGGLAANTNRAGHGAAGTIYLENKTNNIDREMRIIGRAISTQYEHGSDCRYSSYLCPATAAPALPDNTSLIVEYTNFDNPTALNAKSISFNDSRVILGDISAKFFKANNTDVSFTTENININISESIELKNRSYVPFRSDITTPIDIYVSSASYTAFNNSRVKNLHVSGDSLFTSSNLYVEGNLMNTDSRIGASDLHVNGDSSVKSLAANVRIKAIDFPDSFLSSDLSLVEIDNNTSTQPLLARFRLIPVDYYQVMIEPLDMDGYYLRSTDAGLIFSKNDQSPLFKQQATFHIEQGLSNPKFTSFRSKYKSDQYLKHSGNQVLLGVINGDSEKSSATWDTGLENHAYDKLIVARPGSINISGNATFDGTLTGNNKDLSKISVRGLIQSNSDLLVDGINLELSGRHVFADIDLKNQAAISLARDFSSPTFDGLELIADKVVVESGSLIDVSETSEIESYGQYTGGSHGGKGGRQTGTGALLRGVQEQPVTKGAPGRSNDGSSSRGGGTLKLTTNSLELYGEIFAKGGSNTSYGGAGAGGSIWIIADRIESSTQSEGIHADGGNSTTSTYGSGGGGRVALYYNTNVGLDLSKVTANGGSALSSQDKGDNGTVYIKTGSVPPFVSGNSLPLLSNQLFNSFKLTFSAPIEESTFTVDDIGVALISTPSTIYRPISIEALSSTEFLIHFSSAFTHGNYQVTLTPSLSGKNGLALDQNKNLIGGESADAYSMNFVIDTEAPAPTVLAAYPETHTINKYLFSGSKESGSAVLLNGNVVVSENISTTWSYNTPLEPDFNQLSFTLRDKAGNVSQPTIARIKYDNRAPGPVAISVNGRGDGRSILVQWWGYDREANGGDISQFEIYCSTSPFTSINGMYPWTTAYEHEQYRYIQNLERNKTYYVAVVAKDTSGLKNTNVAPVVVTTVDIVPPDIGGLIVVPGLNSLQLTWTQDIYTDDLREHQIFYILNEQPKTVVVGKTNGRTVSYLLEGLSSGAQHSIRVAAVDTTGNINALTDYGVTLLPNPQNVRAEALDESAEIHWAKVNPNQLVKQYALYVQTTPFDNVNGLTPKAIVQPGTTSSPIQSTTLTGLTNDVKYYVAVTAVNISNGEMKQVAVTSVTPQNDADGPEVTAAEFISPDASLALTSAPVLTQSGKFAIKATDKSKIARVVFALNGEPLGNVLITNAQGAYEQALDLLSLADGDYTLGVKVYDMLENVTEKNYPFSIDLIAPAVPTIVAPVQNITINQTNVQATGKSIAGTEVMIAVNGVDLADVTAVDPGGNYSAVIDMVEGLNKIKVKARYTGRTKWSAYGTERSITVNTQMPDAPRGFSATAIKQGQVQLQWSAVTSSNANNQVKGYRVYRSATTFASISDAGVTRLNAAQLITATSYTNTVAVDGNYFYAVLAVNEVGNEGALSNVLSVTADSIGPKITQLTFTPEGEFDAANTIFGRGRVIVNATFSEPLRNAPYFAVVPEAGLPISIDLVKSYGDESVYTGQFQIDQSTASGIAYTTMSAFDNLGNRGTDIQQNNSLKIDTQGPDITQLTIAPVEPLKVDAVSGLHVNVSIRLSEETKAGTSVKLIPMINGSPLAGLDQGIALVAGADNVSFTGEFDLPNTVAQTGSAQLSFAHAAVDELNNASQKIIGQNQFQVYQGNLPPLNTPADLTATALPGGKIKLNWLAVEKAAAYVLYRQGPADTQFIELTSLTALEYEDQTLEDGTYLYAIASVRRENGQESQSSRSSTVSVTADRVAPAKPENVGLELNGAGIVVRWFAPAVDAQGAPQSPQGLTYKLYRTSLPQHAEVTDASVYTPIQTRIPALIALDTKPSEDQHSYFVVAVDAAGNESAPSATDYLNAGLLPVNQLFITLDNNGYPQLSWQHQGRGVELYRVFRKTGDADAELLTPEGIGHNGTNSSYTDNTYNANQVSQGAGQEVVYSVIAVDEHEVESKPHELRLPALSVKLERDKSILLERGVMNQLRFRVDNKGTSAADAVRLYVTLTENGQTREHVSEIFNVAAGANQWVPVVIGGYDKLDAITNLSLHLEQKPQTNQRIRIQQTESVEVGSSSLTLDLSTQNFTRGGSGKVSFNLTNNSDVETELVMATNNSKADSTEVRLILEDLQGNLLTRKTIRQTTGGVINVPSGHTVARVAAKSIFNSEDFSLDIPAAAPDQVRLRLVVDKYHYQLGKENHVEISGMGISKDIHLSDTPYFAIVTDVQPATVNAKNGTVTISGRAVDRTTNEPIANVPVSIVTTVRGFERINTVYSDASGNYVFGYKVDGIAGKYRVSAIHPEMTDRPNHGEFIVEGGSVSPADIDMKVPRNYGQKINLRVRAEQDTYLTNVRLVQIPNAQQAIAELPVGVSVGYSPLANVAANSYKDLALVFTGDNTAADSGLITYRVEADNHTGPNALGTVNISYKLSESAPAVKMTPSVVDTGVAHDGVVHEDIMVTNNGLQPLLNARAKFLGKNSSLLPDWISFTTASNLGNIPVGENRQVQIAIEPKVGVMEGRYEFELIVEGDNLAVSRSIPVFVNVTQSGIGEIAFKISDIYTSTKDTNQQIIEGVNKARIQLQNENVLTINETKNTDPKGEVLFQNMPAGRYTYRVSANDHTSISGRVWIKPGVTSSEKVFLMNTLVSVEWAVREITIEDRYEIKLDAIFKTNVPAPVVVLKPMAVNLPVMKKGDVFQGEFTLTNHGLIRAYNLKEGLPVTNDLVRFEFLKEIPYALEPGQVFTLPYRIQALRDFNPASEATATGGGCGSYGASYTVTYQGKCVNETVVTSQASAHFNSNWGNCVSSGGGASGGGIAGGYIGGVGGGVGYTKGGSAISSEPMWCIADTECDDCNKDNGSAK